MCGVYLGRNDNWEVSQAPFSAPVRWGPGKNRDPAQQLNSQQCLLTDEGGLVIGQVLCLGACGKSKLSLTFTAHFFQGEVCGSALSGPGLCISSLQ